MGATFGKSKSVSLLDKTSEEQKDAAIHTDTQSNGTTTLGRKIKKKKEKLSKTLSSEVRIDKFTSTDGSVVSSSACIKQLVDGAGKNTLPSDALNVEVSSTYRSVTPSKDVQDLRDACVRRGIISPGTNNVILSTSDEQDEEVKTTEALNASTNETPVAIVTNNKQGNTPDTVEVSANESSVAAVENNEQPKVEETVEISANDSVVPVVANNSHSEDEPTTNIGSIEASTNGTSETTVENNNLVHDEQVKAADSVSVSTDQIPAAAVKKNKKKSQNEQQKQSSS